MDDLREKYLPSRPRTKPRSKPARAGRRQEGRDQPENARAGQDDPEERQDAGPKLNALKDEINAALPREGGAGRRRARERLRGRMARRHAARAARGMGTIHPVSQVTEEVTAIFADMGFAVARKARRSKPTGTISTRSTSPAITPRGPRWTPSTCTAQRGRRPPAACAAHPHLAGADPHDGGDRRADAG